MFKIIIIFCLITNVAKAELILGIHPYLDSKTIIERFQPLANHLSNALEEKVVIRVGENYDSHIRAIGKDYIDIAYLGPSSYVKLVKQHGEKAIVGRLEANNKPTFNGYIIVREDSDITNYNDLKGRSFAFGDKSSTMAKLVPQAMLFENEIKLSDLSSYRFLKGHKNIAMAVLIGDADAGAVKEEVFKFYEKKGLRALAKSPDISEHLFVVNNNMFLSKREKIAETLTAIKQKKLVDKLLKPIKKHLTGIVPAKDGDYDSLRKVMALSELGNDG